MLGEQFKKDTNRLRCHLCKCRGHGKTYKTVARKDQASRNCQISVAEGNMSVQKIANVQPNSNGLSITKRVCSSYLRASDAWQHDLEGCRVQTD